MRKRPLASESLNHIYDEFKQNNNNNNTNRNLVIAESLAKNAFATALLPLAKPAMKNARGKTRIVRSRARDTTLGFFSHDDSRLCW